MTTRTITPGENGRFEIICYSEHGGPMNASLTNADNVVSLLIDDLDPDESIQVEIIESNDTE